MKGHTVLLQRNQAKDARTEYAVYAVKIKNEFLLLNLFQANRIIEAALPKRRFSFLGPRKQIVREKKIGDYKSDLYIWISPACISNAVLSCRIFNDYFGITISSE